MKNSIKLFLFFISFVLFINFSLAEEINFESNTIEILEKGNLIKAEGNVKAITDDGLIVTGDRSEYNKEKSILNITGNFKAVTNDGLIVTGDRSEYNKKKSILIIIGNVKIVTNDGLIVTGDRSEYNRKKSILIINGNVFANDQKENNQITSEKIIYNKKKELVLTGGKTIVNYNNLYELNGTVIEHNRSKMILSSKKNTSIKDNVGNVLEVDEFKFEINKEIINAKNLVLFDEFGHKYHFIDAVINLKNNEVLAKDVDVDFENSLFDNEENEPRLKGNSAVSTMDETNIYRAVFTTCKQSKNKKCPAWSISADQVTHDRVKKVIKYKNAWLKIFDKPILYFPRFFHPDPTVKRQSGFLSPGLLNSSYSGQSLQIPYYRVVSENKDLTISPRIFFDNNLILQTEYRQANKNSDAILDLSFNKGENKSRSHFFANLIGKTDKNSYELNLQKVNNDEYLKLYDIKSPIITNVSTLNSFLKFKNNSGNYSLDASVEVFEDLSKKNSDRFEYIYPNYNFSKNIENLSSERGTFNFSSSGFQKNYNTNVYEARIINDLKYNSISFIKNGFLNRYNFLIKNVNTNSENSSNYKDKTENKFLSTIMLESRYPLFKETNNFKKNLTPIFAARYSPTETKNLKNLDRRIDYNNVFSLDRLGQSDTIEGGESLTIGIEYSEANNNNDEVFSIGLANVIRNKKNDDLPTKTTLGNKNSDIFGEIKLNPSKYLEFNYDFSLDNNLNQANYNLLKAKLNINNFVTSFEFLEEDNFIGNKSYISNKTKYNIDNENSISFNTTKDLDRGISEYYNLIYEYQNDCLHAAIEYKKSFYSDGDLKPQENLFFMIRILPFGDLVSPSTPLYKIQ